MESLSYSHSDMSFFERSAFGWSEEKSGDHDAVWDAVPMAAVSLRVRRRGKNNNSTAWNFSQT